ncbi:dynein axonemal assembly factor 3 homolog isoform X2 [Leptopilina boulardi]|uniref:dynein axonemal assembly factor 3 homolog isoform X2 n=1 Tax=Leptopilina boulardi TaxID=63433 RepID=UPI0021F5A104|nr:dynein axonemal assembly factor 3 homolog isoform X2 [Leptopilina boulardi]
MDTFFNGPLGQIAGIALEKLRNNNNSPRRPSELETIQSKYETLEAHFLGVTRVLKPAINLLIESKSADRVNKSGLQEATCYYLDILGNTLLRSATAKFLIQRAKKLSQIPTKNIQCPWLNLEFLRHRDKDQIESIFRFWERATREVLPITQYWDKRLRKSLESRYDYRDGLFDWDFHMILKNRNTPNLTHQEYRFWRENGIAFTWIEGEPSRSNPTLISNIIPEGKGFLHFAYLGDIKNGPFFTWALNEDYTNKKLRSTDVAEKEVMRSIYEIREKAPMCEEIFSAHRDSTILTGTIVTEMPSNEIEQESWSNDKFKIETINLEWIAIPEIEIIFHPIEKLNRFMEKEEFHEKFSLIFLAHNMTKQISNLVPLLKRNCPFIVESRKFLIELKNENLTEFSAELQNIANENGLRNVNNFDSQKQMFARFLKT